VRLDSTDYEFEWGLTSAYGNTLPGGPARAGSDNSVHTVTQNITGLTADTTYHFRVDLIFGSTTINGLDQTFETLPTSPVPTVGTGFTVGSPGSTTATVGAPVNPNGVDTTCVLNYGLTGPTYGSVSPTSGDVDAGSGTSLENITFNLTGLAASTTYHCQLVATNANGIVDSADFTFTTAPGGAPDPVTPPVVT
jgi:hypothetical protein